MTEPEATLVKLMRAILKESAEALDKAADKLSGDDAESLRWSAERARTASVDQPLSEAAWAEQATDRAQALM